MSIVLDALKIARTLLSDDMGLTWTDTILMPKLVQAHGELVNALNLNGVSTTLNETALITVNAGAVNLGVNLPSDIVEPIKMDELGVGETLDNAIGMTKKEFIPNEAQSSFLRYWIWQQGAILLLGATSARQVHLYYIKSVGAPAKVTDTLFLASSETFLGPRVAALVLIKDPSYATVNQIAQENLSSLVRTQLKGDQNLPVRRRPFSSSLRGRFQGRF